ncbi:MAG: hypothetical protein EOO75_07685 [Myxococcales bacterium]|nr:MAG: hypothetical protein EOO75_07685 [Myxococcales bacterium]
MPAAATDWYALSAEVEQRAIEHLSRVEGVDALGRRPGAVGELALVVVMPEYDLPLCERVTAIGDQLEASSSGVHVDISFAAHHGRPVSRWLERPLWVRAGLDES